MKRNFLLLLLMTLLPFSAFADDITVNLVNLQKEYGETLPTSVTEDLFSVQGTLPSTVTKADVAEALQIEYLDVPSTGTPAVKNYHYSMTTKPDYNVSGKLEGHNIFFFGGGNDGLLKIVKKPVTITADNALKTFGDEDPELTAQITAGSMIGDEKLTYTVTRAEGDDVGTYDITVNVTENEVAANYDITTIDGTFAISAKSLTLSDLTIDDIPAVPYQVNPWKPELNITYGETPLVKGTDYTVAYKDNSNPGTATATVTLQGNYVNDGDITKNFTITKYNLSKDEDYATKIVVTGYTGLTYNGAAQEPVITVKLNGTTILPAYCTPTWSNNTNATTEESKAILTITGKAPTFTGTKEIEVEIAKKPLSEVTVASIADETYTGSAITPTVALSFNNGINDINVSADDYTVVGSSNTNVGEATLTITAKENTNYTGSTTATFNITQDVAYIIPQPASKKYGQADPALAWKVEDASGNTLDNSVLKGTVTLARSAGNSVGTYTIYVKSYEPDAGDNYDIRNIFNDPENDDSDNKTATFTINQDATSTLTLKFKEGTVATKVYGEATPTYSLDDLEVVDGLLGTDTWENLKAAATFNTTLESENVDYENNQITATVTGLYNYNTVTVQPLPFTVTPRPFAVIVKSQTITYGNDITRTTTNIIYWIRNTVKENGKEVYTLAEGDSKATVGVVLYTKDHEDIAEYAIDEYEDEIRAKLTNTNYQLVEEDCTWGKLTVTGVTTLDLLADNNDAAKIKAYDGKEHMTVNVTLKRMNVMNANKDNEKTYGWNQHDWNTMVLPFDVSVRDLSYQLGYAIVNLYDTNHTTEGDAKFYLEMNEIPANTPFLVKTAEAISEGTIITFVGRTIKYAGADDMIQTAANGISFCGTYENVVINKTKSNGPETYWKYYADNMIRGIGATSENEYTVYPFTSYFDWTAPSAGVRSMTITVEDVDGSVTAISSIDAESNDTTAEGLYNLNGVKMDGAPTQKGIYIKNGKKVVIR